MTTYRQTDAQMDMRISKMNFHLQMDKQTNSGKKKLRDSTVSNILIIRVVKATTFKKVRKPIRRDNVPFQTYYFLCIDSENANVNNLFTCQ